MSRQSKFSWTIVAFPLLAGLCSSLFLAGPVRAANPIRIDCIGDSITLGYTDNPTWSVPYEFGYRSGLYTLLNNAGYSFQFVGSSPEPWNGASGLPTNTPSPDLRTVNQDHCEGYGGWNTSNVLSNIGPWLAADNPNVVLLMIGINDISPGSSGNPTGAESNLNAIVQNIVTTKPNANVIVAQVTPYASGYTDSIVEYNNYIANSLVPYYQGLHDHVTTVNQYANLLTNGTIDPTKYSNGINHPSNAVYNQMAQTWFQGIQAAGITAASSTASAPLIPGPYWSGSGTWDLNVTQDWGTISGGPYNTAYWTDSTTYGRDAATFEGTAGAVTLNSNLSAYVLQFTASGGGYTISGAKTLTLGAGGINAAAQTSGATTIAGGTLSLWGGQSWTLGGGTLTVNDAVARNIGATVNFSSSGAFNGSGLLASVGTAVGGGPSGVAWATIGGADWAVSNGTQTIAASYTPDAWASGNNTDVTSTGANPASGATTNSLRFNSAGTKTLTLAGVNTVTSGGILMSANNNGAVTISGGTLAGPAGKELVVMQNNTSNGLTISSVIANNGSATGLTKSGPGTLTLMSTNTYSGPTTVSGGMLSLNNPTTGFVSATTVGPGATLALNSSSNLNLSTDTAFTIALNNGGTLQNYDGSGLWTWLGGAVTVSGATTINQTSPATSGAGEAFFLGGGLQGSGICTVNAANAGSGVVLFGVSNTSFSGTLAVNGVANTTPFGGSGLAPGGCTTGLQNADIVLNGTLELGAVGIGWYNGNQGWANTFRMGALSGTGAMALELQ